ncbi:MAG: AAA family ATPase [Clostridiales bacterium]|nr:AAA family ATPase [Clostridiales bacterium]
MRWKTLRLRRFGSLKDLEQDLAPWTVILGPNEAGKTTLRHALSTLLLGFRQRKDYPWNPWDGGEPHLEGVLETGEGSLTVVRRLLSQPKGHLLDARGKRHELGNRPLPFVPSPLDQLYEPVYTLTAANLGMLKEDLWHPVEEALMGPAQGQLLPVGKVLSAIREEHEALWHQDRRKGSVSRRLEEERARLYQDLQQAREREEALFRLEDELSRLEERIQEVEAEFRREEQREKERIRLEDLGRRLELFRKKAAEAGPYEHLAVLPPDPRPVYEALLQKEEDLEERCREKERQLEELEAEAALSPFEKGIWELREDLARALSALETLRRHRAELEDLEPRLARVEGELKRAAHRLFQEPAVEDAPPLLSPEGEGLFRRWLAAREEHRAAEERLREEEDREARRQREGAALRPLGFLGLAFLVAGLLLALMGQTGGLFMAGGGLLTLFLWAILRGRGLPDPYLTRWREAEERAREEERRAFQELSSRLAPLTLAPSLVETLSADELENRWNDLRSLLAEREELLQERKRREDAVQQEEAYLQRLWAQLPSPPDHLSYHQLPDIFHPAVERARRAEASRLKKEEVLREWQELQARRQAVREKREELEARLKALAPEPRAALAEAERRIEAFREAEMLRRQLEEEGETLQALEEAVERARREGLFQADGSRREALLAERQQLQEEKEALLSRRGELMQGPTPSLLLGEIQEREEELQRVRRRRDRLFLMQRILEEGKRRFREKYQPETLRLASRYLEAFTQGRYRRLFVDEDDGPPGFADDGRVSRQGPQLMVEGDDGVLPAAFPLSQGTLHQIYLALRLGLLSHLEGGGEPLPLLLDETFVHFDPGRRQAAWEVLKDLSRDRQILYFTCHPSMAAEAEEKGAQVMELPGLQTRR